MSKITVLRSLQTRLLLFFLAISLIPLIGVGWLTFAQSREVSREELFNQLIAVRDLKAGELNNFFTGVSEDIILTSHFPFIIEAMQAFSTVDDFYAVRQLGYLANPALIASAQDTPYDQIHAQYHTIFQEIIETKGYDDIYLITPDGNVAYNFDKGNDFATNLFSGDYRNTHLAELFKTVSTSTSSNEVQITDFVQYTPSDNLPASFVGTPIVVEGQTIGVLIYQIPLDRINQIMQANSEFLSERGELYLVGGPDQIILTETRFSENSTMPAEDQAVQAALAG
ncbi:MAG: hypothetical protein AAF485_30910, partial [Chloroflexota bacterium]